MNSKGSQEIRQGDLWAWLVNFIVSIGLHVGVVLFVALSIALFTYAIVLALSKVSVGVHLVIWFFVAVSLAVCALLIQMQVQSFRPHIITGLGRIAIATSGCELGEIAADLGTGLFGLAQLVPLLWFGLRQQAALEASVALTALIGSLFLVIGWGSLILRLWLRRKRRDQTRQGFESSR